MLSVNISSVFIYKCFDSHPTLEISLSRCLHLGLNFDRLCLLFILAMLCSGTPSNCANTLCPEFMFWDPVLFEPGMLGVREWIGRGDPELFCCVS